MDISSQIKEKLLQSGFDDIGFTNIENIPDQRIRLEEYLTDGYHGEMSWLEKNKERRSHPKKIWDEAKSIIVLSKNYGPEENPLKFIDRKKKANISVYARGNDYHELIKEKLKEASVWLKDSYKIESRYFVDTAPIMEKPIAQIAGLGWQGKHTNLVSRKLGSWFFLGVILLSVRLPSASAEIDHCGSCTSCIDICPTNAIIEPYKLDSRKCISYLTIELKGHIPKNMRKSIGNRVYGCDDCLAVCPWNKFAEITNDIKLRAREELNMPNLLYFLGFDREMFNDFFRDSPIKRIGRDRFIRNILIATGNSGMKDYIPKIIPHLTDEIPIVRAASIWAIKQLTSDKEFDHFKKNNMHLEKDDNVMLEWN